MLSVASKVRSWLRATASRRRSRPAPTTLRLEVLEGRCTPSSTSVAGNVPDFLQQVQQVQATIQREIQVEWKQLSTQFQSTLQAFRQMESQFEHQLERQLGQFENPLERQFEQQVEAQFEHLNEDGHGGHDDPQPHA
jgi:hypothetical protein